MNRVLTKYIILAAALLISGAVTAQSSSGVYVGGRVFGGGNEAIVSGSCSVNVGLTGTISNGLPPTINGDVYGGGALAHVNVTVESGEVPTYTHTDGAITTVDITYGTLNGNVYGGGLGDDDHAAAVYGEVTVNIGKPDSEGYIGDAILNGNVFGCNNANGTPKDDVTVNIYKTHHETKDYATYFGNDREYAIDSVFGGGNKANYEPDVANKKSLVHVWTCENTIQKVYGGGNAADVGTEGTGEIKSSTNIIIDGGRVEWLFGGGNGAGSDDPASPYYNPGANIYDDVNITFNAGDVIYFFGGSNEKGDIAGDKNITINNLEGCSSFSNHIASFYGGNNLAPITGNVGVTLTMPCTDNPCKIDTIFGGSRNADISGDVVLTLNGGLYDYVFGGNNHGGTISGDVTLNLFGGTINEKAFGGNNKSGNITGKITVNMLEQECDLVVHNIYGGGYDAAYVPTTPGDYPEINLIHGTVLKKTDHTGGSVFGGGYGSTATVTSSPVVNVGYNASMATLVEDLLPSGTSLTTNSVSVEGDVYGGGELASVVGSTTINIDKVPAASGGTAATHVGGDIYGGCLGRLADPDQGVSAVAAEVDGNVQVTVNGGTIVGSVFGCNNVNGAPTGTVNVDIYGTDEPDPGEYALSNVFGGGNQAAYTGIPVVKVHNCGNSIEYVYGGGNAASVRGTDVTIYGGNTIGNVFGGCYGADVTHEGTNVKIYGGTILKVFGGNNQNGGITGDILVNVNKQTEPEHSSCPMKIEEVYGGGNVAGSASGAITIGCTGALVTLGENQHYGIDQEGIRYVYGGAYQAPITGDISLTINSGIVENVFGGNNASGAISGQIQVNINKTNETPDCGWYVGNVYGGGNLADYTGNPAVTVSSGLVSGDVFGGGLGTSAVVTGNPVVRIDGGTVEQNVFGGGSLAAVSGNTHVTVNSGGVNQDVYGGGAFANTGATTVDIMGGTISRDIYGGGLGDSSHAPVESGVVTVNIGARATGNINELTEHLGSATIGGSVYGCNNASGSPQDNVFVNIYGTAHTTTDMASYIENDGVNGPPTYAIDNVFGGGNRANYLAGKTATVNVYGCANTIRRTFGGGNAAATNTVNTYIMGGRFDQVFGGGNGEVTAANINGDVTLGLHGGYVNQFYGGSNNSGAISGTININVDNTSPCGGNLVIEEFFCGGNFADIYSGIVTDIDCSQGMEVHNIYGGCNQANIWGDVVLNLRGGTYTNVFGGSKGVAGGISADIMKYPDPEDPEIDEGLAEWMSTHSGQYQVGTGGNVTLNLYGGTIGNVFGGSNINGNIDGIITVNVIDAEGDCPLYITNIYGGSNETDYTPSGSERITPIVNVIHAKNGIAGNVYGGSRGKENANTPTAVKSSPLVNIGYDSSSMGGYVPDGYSVPTDSRAIVAGDVYGGGDAATVNGNTAIFLRNRAKVFGNVYGGGNMGAVEDNPDTTEVVEGNTKVIVNGDNE